MEEFVRVTSGDSDTVLLNTRYICAIFRHWRDDRADIIVDCEGKQWECWHPTILNPTYLDALYEFERE